MCASRGQGEAETWLYGVQAAGAGGKGKGKQRGQSGEMGGGKQWGQETQRERWGGRGVKDRLGKGEGDGRAPRLLRVGTARAGTKGEDLSN